MSYCVIAEFDQAELDRAEAARHVLAGEAIDGAHTVLSIANEHAPSVSVVGVNEDAARRASVALVRAGASHLMWTDASGRPLAGPGRSRRQGGWWRLPADRRSLVS